MITQETAGKIWNAYRDIAAGEKLLQDTAEVREREHMDKMEPVLKDAFGRRRNLELGIPTGDNGHRILNLSPLLAESIIRAHIANMRAELATLNEVARAELDTP